MGTRMTKEIAESLHIAAHDAPQKNTPHSSTKSGDGLQTEYAGGISSRSIPEESLKLMVEKIMESESAACNTRLDDHHNCIAELYSTQQQLTVLIQDLKTSHSGSCNWDDITGLYKRMKTLEGQLKTQGAMLSSLVVPCGERNMKTASCHDKCASSHQGAQEPDATLTKQTEQSSHLHLEVRECDMQRDKLFRFNEIAISEHKLKSDKQYQSTTEDTSPLAEFKVTPPPVAPSARPQQAAPP